MLKKIYPFIDDAFVIFILLISGWKYIYGLEKILDVGLYDESTYLYNGVTLFVNGLPGAQAAPLYAIWYYLLSLIQPDTIQLYSLNYKVFTVLTPILLYILLRNQDVHPISSAIISFFFLISDANWTMWPKVSHFSLIIILAFLILATYRKISLFSSLAFILIGSLLSSYARPEFFLTYLLFLAIFIGLLVISTRKEWQSSRLATFVSVVLVSGILISSFGLPLSGNRSLVAFGQHFSVNWTQWNRDSGLSPWTNWEEIINQNFGNIDSPMEALFSNPVLFFSHTIANVIGTPEVLFNLFFQHTNLVLSNQLRATEGYILFGLILLLLFISRNRWLPQLHDRLHASRNSLLIYSLFLITSFISVVAIFPRPHYLLLPGVLIIIAIAALVLGQNPDQQRLNNRLILIGLGMIIFFVTPQIYQGGEGFKPNIQTITFIRDLDINEDINMLEGDGGYCYYLGDNCHRISQEEKNVGCNTFLSDRKINMIVLSDVLMVDSRFREDVECMYFLGNYEDFGYTKLDIPEVERDLIVAKQLLNQ